MIDKRNCKYIQIPYMAYNDRNVNNISNLVHVFPILFKTCTVSDSLSIGTIFT